MKRRLSKSDIKELNLRLGFIEIFKKDDVDLVESEGESVYFVNSEPWVVVRGDMIFPHLKLVLAQPSLLARATVDMGAVRFVTNGADVMRPGIVSFAAGVREGDLVAVDDVTHHKALAVGVALVSSEQFSGMTSGKAIRTIHYVGDKIWNLTT